MFQVALLLATVKRGLSFTLGKYLNMNGSVRQGMAACAQPSGGGDIIILPKYQQQVWEIISLHLIISRYGEVVTGWSSTGWPWAGEGGERGGRGGGGEQHLWNYFIQAGKQYSTSQPTRPRIGNLTHSKLPALPSIPVLG